MVGSRGPVIKHTTVDESGKKKIEYKSIKQNIDVAKLKRGEYELADVIDEKGNIVNIQRKTYIDKDGREIKEEITKDHNGNQQIVRKKVIKDKDGHDVIEETVINSDGSK